MRDMNMTRKALIAAFAIASFSVASPAAGAPTIPDFSGYAEDDLSGYSVCGGNSHGPKHCIYQFNSSSGDSHFVCGLIPTTTGAYCVEVQDKGRPVREFLIGDKGTVSIETREGEDADFSGGFESSQTLPLLHKVVYGQVSSDSGLRTKAYFTCGAGEDGSVACQNAAGHGFVLSHDGSKTW